MKLPLPFTFFRKIYISLLAFALILLCGAIGYVVLEKYTLIQALYMTVITLSTVGFGEVKPLDTTGMIFTMVLIVTGIGTFTYFIAQVFSYFLNGEFISTYKLYKMKNAIRELEGHIIICGFGRNGREAARIFNNSRRSFVVVERHPIKKEDKPPELNYLLEDDARRDETLLEAGIERAHALVSTLPDDADNLFVVLSARALNPNIKIVSRASNDSTVRKLKTAGANNVIMPDKIGGAHMATLVLSPDVKEFVDLLTTQSGDHFEIAEIVSARTISVGDLNCWAQTGATILGMKATSGEYILNPPAKTVIHAGNRLIVMGSRPQLNKVKQLMI